MRPTPFFIIAVFFLFLLGCNSTPDFVFRQAESPHTISESMVLKKGQRMVVEKGCTLKIDTGVTIRSFGDLIMKGTEKEPIVIEPVVPGIGWGRFHLKGNKRKVELEYCHITDGHITSYNNINSIRHCQFKNNQALTWETAILRFWLGAVLVEDCTFKGNNKGEGVLVHNTNKPVVRNCQFNNVPDGVEYLDCKGGIISNNTFINGTDDAIDLNHCEGIEIAGNTIKGYKDAGMEIGSEGFGPSTNITIQNNWVHDCLKGIWLKESSEARAVNNSFVNNSIALDVISLLNSDTLSYAVAQNNIFYQNKRDFQRDEISLLSFEYNLTDRSPLLGKGNITGKPLFHKDKTGAFVLSSYSPAIDAGDPASPKDADGSRADIGPRTN